MAKGRLRMSASGIYGGGPTVAGLRMIAAGTDSHIVAELDRS